MNEYFVQYLNNITCYIMANDWKDAIIEAKLNAERKLFANTLIKYIIDEDGTIIKNINVNTLEYTFGEKEICGNQAIDVKAVI